MTFLLDTNVMSEWVKPRPHPGVVSWLAEVDEDRVFISVASLAEIRHGIELMTQGRHRQMLAAWLAEDLPSRFAGRILDVDRHIAAVWGAIMARSQQRGANIGAMDALFAATAEARRLTLVTRNARHFQGLGVLLHNPWEAGL